MNEADRRRRRGIRPAGPPHPVWTAVIGIALLILAVQPGRADEWHVLEKTDDGIQILRREGNNSLVAFRGIGVVNAPLPLVATVIFDADRRLEWIEGLAFSRIIRWEGKDSFIEYDHIDMPIFFRDRDFVSRVTISSYPSEKKMVFQYRPAVDPAAPPSRYVRGELLDATFILVSIEHGTKTRIDADFECDPKGLIPKWLVNFFVKDWPKTTFRNLRKELRKPGLTVDPRFSRFAQDDTAGQ